LQIYFFVLYWNHFTANKLLWMQKHAGDPCAARLSPLTFRIPHFTRHYAADFRTVHSAFYFPHSAFYRDPCQNIKVYVWVIKCSFPQNSFKHGYLIITIKAANMQNIPNKISNFKFTRHHYLKNDMTNNRIWPKWQMMILDLLTANLRHSAKDWRRLTYMPVLVANSALILFYSYSLLQDNIR